jgi:hypothetical protein
MSVTGTLKNGWGIKATQVAPGSFCFMLGVVLGVYILHTTGFDYQQLIQQTMQDSQHAPASDINTSTRPCTPLESKEPGHSTSSDSKVTGQTSVGLHVYGLQGESSLHLSTRIRYALSDIVICSKAKPNLPGQNADMCEDAYFAHYSHIPSKEDITRIEQEEVSAAANDPKAKKALQDEANAIEVH